MVWFVISLESSMRSLILVETSKCAAKSEFGVHPMEPARLLILCAAKPELDVHPMEPTRLLYP